MKAGWVIAEILISIKRIIRITSLPIRPVNQAGITKNGEFAGITGAKIGMVDNHGCCCSSLGSWLMKARLRRVRQAWHRAETGQVEAWWQLYVAHRAPEDAQNTDPMQGWL